MRAASLFGRPGGRGDLGGRAAGRAGGSASKPATLTVGRPAGRAGPAGREVGQAAGGRPASGVGRPGGRTGGRRRRPDGAGDRPSCGRGYKRAYGQAASGRQGRQQCGHTASVGRPAGRPAGRPKPRGHPAQCWRLN